MTHLPIDKIAVLSNLMLTKLESEKFQKQLDETVEFVDNLSELDTEHVIPTSSPSGNKNVFFEDGKDDSRKLSPGEYTVDRIL